MSDVTKPRIDLISIGALKSRDRSPMKLDLFEDAEWRQKMSEPATDGSVTVTLSTGRTVTVNSQFLAFLRILAEELAEDDPLLN
ncbi:MAG: hypothetical protein AB7F91_17985 [Parvularculaceae bacterium]